VLRDTNNASCVVLGSTALSLQAGVWAYVEVKVTVHNSTGTVDVRINGVSALSLTGQNTRGTGSSDAWNNVNIGFMTQTASVIHTCEVDDLVVMDGSGSLNNSFLGDVTVSAIYPSGAGTTSGWTPSAGSNYACCNEALIDDDTSYVSATTLTTKDLYAFTDAPTGANIKAVQLCIGVRKGAEGPGQLTPVVRSNSIDYDQTAFGDGGTSYSFLRTVVEADPNTSAAWAEAAFNAAQFGFKKTG
jgi:hypothetical protein